MCCKDRAAGDSFNSKSDLVGFFLPDRGALDLLSRIMMLSPSFATQSIIPVNGLSPIKKIDPYAQRHLESDKGKSIFLSNLTLVQNRS